MRVYVAGSSQELDRVQWAMRAVRDMGHEITEDWTRSIVANGPDDTCDEETLRYASLLDMAGVMSCSLFWLLLLSGANRPSCFWTLADKLFENDTQALEWIERQS